MTSIYDLRGAFEVDGGRGVSALRSSLDCDRDRSSFMAAKSLEAAAVIDALRSIRPDQRDLLKTLSRRDQHGCFQSYRAAARAAGVSHQTIKLRADAALAALDRALAEARRGGAPEGMDWR